MSLPGIASFPSSCLGTHLLEAPLHESGPRSRAFETCVPKQELGNEAPNASFDAKDSKNLDVCVAFRLRMLLWMIDPAI
jgi:hypothetical protein